MVVAPAYHGYRHTLVVVCHTVSRPYPAQMIAEPLAIRVKPHTQPVGPTGMPDDPAYPTAHSDVKLIELMQQALAADSTTALLLSLIAQSNEGRSAGSANDRMTNGDDAGTARGPDQA